MRDSLTYQAILEEGRVEGRAEGRAEGHVEAVRQILLEIAEDRFGPADDRIRAALAAIRDGARLHALVRRVSRVATWDELLDSMK